MQKIKIKSFDVENVRICDSDGLVNAIVGVGKYKVFDGNQEQHGPSVGNMSSPYFIGEDREGAELMEFNGMDFVRTVRRVVKKSHVEMFKETLEKLEGCLVQGSSGETYVYYKNEPFVIGCGDVFEKMRPYMSVKVDKPKTCIYGVIEKQSLFIFSKEMEKLLNDNANRFLGVYNALKGMS